MSKLIDQLTVEFPVGEHSHVLCLLYTDCIVLMPGTQSGDKLLTIPGYYRSYRFEDHPEFKTLHNPTGWNLRQLRALLRLIFITARVE